MLSALLAHGLAGPVAEFELALKMTRLLGAHQLSMCSQGEQESDVAGRETANNCLVVVEHAIEEGASDQGVGVELGHSEVLRLREGAVCHHGG